MEMPRVDIIITHCNLNSYLDAAVRSALDQDGVRSSVIVVDDASEIPATFGDWPIERVTLIHREVRGGQGAALNTGLALSRAPLVSLLDADDLYPAHRSQVLTEGLAARQADIAFGGQVVFNDGDQPVLRVDPALRRELVDIQAAALPGTALFTRALFDRVGPFDQTRAIGTFIEWMLRVRRMHPPGTQTHVPEVTLLRRSHARNMTRTNRDAFADYLHLAAEHRSRRHP